jgi:hypothetical protein
MAPYMTEKLQLWDKYVDGNGKTTLNMEEYMTYRKEMSEKAKSVKKQKLAAAGKKGKL